MGTSYTAVAGIGVFVSFEDKAEKYIEHSCQHPERQGQQFCPKCGVKVASYSRERMPDDIDEIIETMHEGEAPPKGYLCERVGYESETWFVGWGASFDRDDVDGSESAHEVIPDFDTIRETIKSILAEAGAEAFYDESTFGFHHYMIAQ